MPIEFHCNRCGQLLRVPETAAGKQARCPKCQALMAVPLTVADILAVTEETTNVGGSPPTPSPVASTPPAHVAAQLSSSANPFAGELPTTMPQAGAFSEVPGSLNPYASPASAGQGYAADYYYFGPRTGLPWENEPRTLGCFFRTMSAVLGSPTRAFSIMRRDGGLGIPLLYNLYAVGMLMAIGMLFLLPILALVMVFNDQDNGPEIAGFVGGMAIFGAIYLLVLVVIVPLVSAAAMHVILLMMNGAKQGFETTFRVMCYGYYSALVPATFLNLVPYLGGLASIIWIIVLLVHGLARGHEISGGKATVAVVLPLFACCGLFIGLAIGVAVWSD
ncbi:MAG TPA: YIP1 family protein [Pirellulaceae bacterium]